MSILDADRSRAASGGLGVIDAWRTLAAGPPSTRPVRPFRYGGILTVIGLLNAGAVAGAAAVAIPGPFWASAAGLIATAVVPGALLAIMLVLTDDLEPFEWAALVAGLGAVALMLGGLVLAYLPVQLGPVAVIAWSATLGLILSALAFKRSLTWEPPRARDWTIGADCVLVLLAGAALRLPGLGYSEFQGDETEVILRATGVVQDLPDALFYHGKGPGEVVVTAVQYGLVGTLSEGSARLPFALAELAGLALFYLLARRLLGRPGALVAAMLLVLNGYLIAFARIAQYQGLVFLMSVLAVWCALRWSEGGGSRWPALAGVFAAVGALAHYDAIFALPPIVVLAVRRGGVRGLLTGPSVQAWGLGALLGALVLGLFFGPYLTSPLYGLASGRIADRVGTGFPHDNLGGILASAGLYASASYLVLLAGLTALGTLWPLARRRGPVPRVWLLGAAWFVVPFLFYAFVARKPGTHIHVASTGLALLAGWGFATAWAALPFRVGRVGLGLGVVAAGAVVAAYVAPVYLQTSPELVRENGQGRLPLAWSFAKAPDKERFGFPYQAGWKVVGALFGDGTLSGSYDSNEVPQVTQWYTRGAWRCSAAPRYFVIGENVQDALDVPTRRIASEYGLIGVVTIDGREKLRIHERGAPKTDQPAVWPAESLAERFDRRVSQPTLDPGPWARGALAPSGVVAPVRFGEAVELLGYQLFPEGLRPGGRLHLDLAWTPRVTADQDYAIDLRLGDEPRAGDGNGPGCDSNNPTEDWVAGEPFVQRASVAIAPDARPGTYPLLVGVTRTGERGGALAPETTLPTHGNLVQIGTIEVRGGG